MLSNRRSFSSLLASMAAYAEAPDDHVCATDEVLAIAEHVKTEFDAYFGLGNWYSAMLVRTVGEAVALHPSEMPCIVLRKVYSIMRHAGESNKGLWDVPHQTQAAQ